MKIEIGESLVSSYLKHVEQCKIIQTNWKVSENWSRGAQDIAKSKSLFNEILKSSKLKNIFKNNSFEQLLKQAEIDVLGINTIENTIYAYDIAFHAFGLKYKGGNQGNCENVMKKIFRAIFSVQIYFPEFSNIESYFLSPKTNKKLDDLLQEYFEEATNIMNDENIKIKYISNNNFFETIVDPVIQKVSNDHDASELYLRAIKLNRLDSRSKIKGLEVNKVVTQKRTESSMKIGQYVKNCMFNLSQSNRLDEDEISNLQSLNYCKSKFNISYPVLKKRGLHSIERYYKDEKIVEGYWLCSQWIEKHWDYFLKWENSKK
ncbi:hypothetical protein N9S18_00845 [Flavobacteriaceae bacterium]|nr:hypothetical protein [Flavobacteriaceae bacterium]